MKLYTKTGDAGQTSLYGGERRSKADRRIAAYGDVDELQALLGVVVANLPVEPVLRGLCDELQQAQADCFVLCCELARTTTKPERHDPVLKQERVAWLEGIIDQYDAQVPPLRNFIMQGGSQAGAYAHLARAVCRRAERAVVELDSVEEVSSVCKEYLNRLSDALFVMARMINHTQNIQEVEWHVSKD